jgi:cytidyltransferase-like protein
MLLFDRHRKIKSAQEVRNIIGPRPREKRVIMCHGVFDVVHPGHVRHLLYAKSKADVLVASVTADRHIDKGQHRPHVPQDLRAANLAAFEAVDYVVIDHNAKPTENIRIIEPDYFAKGFEYAAIPGTGPGSGAAILRPALRTTEEAAVIHAYGGEIIFTPGDIVYSSTGLLDLAPPSIKLEKLALLMERSGLTFDSLRQTLGAMKGRPVHVVGDTIVDSLTHCTMIGGQTKTPTLSALFERRSDYVGGAGIVAKHMAAAGGLVTFTTVLGDDALRYFVLDDLRADMDVIAVIAPSRPTANKNAIVVGGYRLLKIDTLDNQSISDQILAEMTDAIHTVDTDAVIFSDFRHGIFNRRTIPQLVGAIPEGCFRVADSQVASRWGNITDFQGFDLITPNEREARFATGDQDSGIRALALNLHEAAKCKCLILKLGERGTLTQAGDESFVVDSFAGNVVDPVGAGDALLAYATLAMVSSCRTMATRDPVTATILGVFAAGVACERDGNVPVSAGDVEAKIDAIEGASQS